jgi:hypothetical protein
LGRLGLKPKLSHFVGSTEDPIIIFIYIRLGWTQPSHVGEAEGPVHLTLYWKKLAAAGHEFIHIFHAIKKQSVEGGRLPGLRALFYSRC